MSTVVNPEPNPFAKRRVLVVEDNLDSVHSMAVLLKVMGHDVEYAINGFAALDIARRFRPEFVLLDVSLPHLSGDQVARQLKYEPGLEKTRMIAITGLPLDQVERLVLEAGCEAVYAKPIAPAVLEELLATP
jgi:two-component system, sensor histidine kinase